MDKIVKRCVSCLYRHGPCSHFDDYLKLDDNKIANIGNWANVILANIKMCQMKNGLKEDVNIGALVDAKSTSAIGRRRGNGLNKI